MKIKLKELLTETRINDYGCVMLYFDFPRMSEIHSLINENDIFINPDDDSYGLEDEPHCTLLYGLHEGVTIKDVLNSLRNITFGDCRIHTPSLFENERYDVLKFEVGYPTRGGAFLHKANQQLKKFPYTSEYPNYHPHLTIAYLKNGMGKKYVDILNKNKLTEFVLAPAYGVYSQTNGNKIKFKI